MKEELLKTFEIVRKGGVILYPTDTVWGLGCDATVSKSIDRIAQIKKRPVNKAMIVLLDLQEKLYQYVEDIPEIAFDFMKNIITPLTIIYPRAKNLPKNLIAEDGSIAIRITHDEFCNKLINMMNAPLVSTSANFSGEPTPLIYSKINPGIIDQVDYVVDLNKTRIKEVKSSTVIKFTDDGEYKILRS
ncbi:MAG TPA: L-threonylcarbamoyladenylate synthase [Bacteroidales bacterium]|jgi:L-threonylcarbamoyladenylate synthase|nr:threonylcarbamoyl-AMP synthase [Bacteroidales bacterium]HNZ41868.1 L-threonylcarbamoyladenylate synthase [Bacteroidales bacterium]HOH83327.1 L-threonylcarbamoyladenylate synthase [Bacteroidales bacterium]HPB24449.1 L-threonylcarbamoyladenylate synthase [Bacteroidales bacterium]HPI29284.1 L-threonylcarbamoyladenylate synthase [Bacteroidales bacterium]